MSEIQEYVRLAHSAFPLHKNHFFTFRELHVIDNQRILNQLSNKLEPRQT